MCCQAKLKELNQDIDIVNYQWKTVGYSIVNQKKEQPEPNMRHVARWP